MSDAPAPPTFPPHTHAKLSPRTYLAAHLTSSPPTRPSGRSPDQSRPVTVHTGSLTYCHGSAVLRQGDTTVVCGVRGEILKADDIPNHAQLQSLDSSKDQSTNTQTKPTKNTKVRSRDKKEQDHMAYLGLLVPNIELATGCSPDHLPGGPPSTTAQALSQRLLSALHTTGLISPHRLRIFEPPPKPHDTGDKESTGEQAEEAEEENQTESGPEAEVQTPSENYPTPSVSDRSSGDQGDLPTNMTALRQLLGPSVPKLKAYWTLYIDSVVISLDHGPRSLFDPLFTAMLSALRNTKLPQAYWSTDDECVLCDPNPANDTTLMLRKDLPVATSFGVFTFMDREETDDSDAGEARTKTNVILSDPDAFEEDLCEEVLTVTVVGKAKVCTITKSGGGCIDPERLEDCVRLAQRRRDRVLETIEKTEEDE